MMRRITTAARSVTDAIRTSADRHMRLVLALLVATHLGLVVLDLAGRAAYGGIEPTWLGDAVDSPILPIGSSLIAFGLLVSPHPPRLLRVLWASDAWLTTWASLNLAVGLTAGRPVSLVGPLLAFAMAGVSAVATDYWATRETRGPAWTES